MNTQVNNLTNVKMEGNFLFRWFQKQKIAFDETRYGHMVIFLTLQSCIGSIACMYNLENHGSDFLLIIAAAMTMWSNAMFIAQAKAKWSLIVFYASVIINGTIILISVI